MSDQGKKRKLSEIDNLYAMGTVLVILGHSHSSDWSAFSGTFFEHLIFFIYLFHMPLFFFVAGFLFLNSNTLLEKGITKWLYAKATKLLVPYVVLSLIGFLPKYYFENHGFSGISKYALEAIFIPRIGVWGHLWFLPVLMVTYLIFGMIRAIAKTNVKKILFVSSILSLVLLFEPITTQWFGFDDFKKMSVFFVAGMLWKVFPAFRKIEDPVKMSYAIILAGTGFSIVLYKLFYGHRIPMLIVAIVMILVCWFCASKLRQNTICTYLSKHNFTIYIYFWPAQAVSMFLLTKLGFTWYLTSLVMFMVGICVPLILIWIYEYIPVIHNKFFDLLLGVK